MKIILSPGSVSLSLWAIDMFGRSNVEAEKWGSPVIVNNVDEQDIEIVQELLSEDHIKIEIKG